MPPLPPISIEDITLPNALAARFTLGARLLEEIVKRYDRLDYRAVGIALQSIATYHSRHETFSCLCRRSEKFDSAAHLSTLICVHYIFSVRELHLADVYNPVAAVDQHVDLRITDFGYSGFAAP